MDVTISEVLYSASSFHAMIAPVSIAMVLSALSVVFLNSAQSRINGEMEMASYSVWKVDDTQRASNSSGKNLLLSLGNTFVMVCFIVTLTFGIVLLYKYRFMKCLVGYMMFSSATILGVLGGTMLTVGVNKYRIPIDKFTFYFCLYNFSVVGTIAVYFGYGVPTKVTQGYLVSFSIILAWQLSHFDAWTAWTLLVMLALYDLCAVLTPCGPLKALVGLMQQEGAPEMPGLLYEAQLPEGAERRIRRPGTGTSSSTPSAAPRTTPSTSATTTSASGNAAFRKPDTTAPTIATTPTPPIDESRIITLPYALARVYRLPLLSSLRSPNAASLHANHTSPLLEEPTDPPTPAELTTEVEVVMPSPGGRIVRTPDNKFLVYDRDGELRRTLHVNRQGRVMQELGSDDDDDDDAEYRVSNSIKLGLGDFIFYSVLVSKAAMHSFTAFACCMLVILAGMGATLVLLSVYKAALPALPISIFLGVTFYLLSVLSIEPWIENLFQYPLYV